MTTGIVDVGSKPHQFKFIADKPARVGEYVTVSTGEGDALALVEDSEIHSQALSEATNYFSAREGSDVARDNPRDKKYVATARVLGLVEELKKGSMQIPSVPAIPGTEVREADATILNTIFSRERWAKIGSLLRNKDIDVSVDLSKMASRHLAILAATGSGKSNLLALIAKRIAEVNGTMLILDYHAEYSQLKIPGIVHVQAKVNPKLLDTEELADMLDIRERAEKQRSLLAEAFNDEVRQAADFWQALLGQLSRISEDQDNDAQDKRTARRLIEIVQRAQRRKGRVIDPSIADPIDQLSPNHVNVLNMLELTEAQADTVISYYLDRILEDRKTAVRAKHEQVEERVKFWTPIVIAIEEAHTFLPADRNANSKTKEIAAKIAREGRKFGVSLIVVSQRPSKLDQDILSQMGSLAVSRITQPKDQSYIMESTEFVSEEMAGFLPSLNVGEVVLLGQWVVLPSVVKAEKVPEKLIGADIDAVGEWLQAKRLKEMGRESTSDFIRSD
jgi:DNA helicase HerA-like ATPase